MADLQMPIGADFFRELREDGLWYCDKTGGLAKFLRSHAKVSLFTRPRRFGKTLTMDTLAEFLDISKDSRDVFAGLDIMKNEAVCSAWMNKCPVIFLTLKDFEGLDFESAMQRLHELLADWGIGHSFLLSSPAVEEEDKEYLRRIRNTLGERPDLSPALFRFSRMLASHYGRSVVILIDEYDVPIAKAETNGFYRPMIDFIRVLLGKALKSNPNLKFGVLTGCLRIAKESIFTGLNNFNCYPLSNASYADTFGFTPAEISTLLETTGFANQASRVREWYDGYRFGKNTEIYCPWDVVSFVAQAQEGNDEPQNFWNNSSGNEVVQQLIRRTNSANLREDVERLMKHECIEIKLTDQLTYSNLYKTEQNLWSLLYQTGYLTKADQETMDRCNCKGIDGRTCLVIPNKEVYSIYIDSVQAWLQEYLQAMDRTELFESMWSGDVAAMSTLLTDGMYRTISYYDRAESYYHGFLTGIFTYTSWDVTSNREAGDGRHDLQIVDAANKRAVIIEAKVAKEGEDLEALCHEGLAQIEIKKYVAGLPKGVTAVKKYGAAFYHKTCLVLAGETGEKS